MLKQIEGIGPSFARLLSNVGIASFEKLRNTDARMIEFVSVF
jgi:predicted flap endonuclease-1-like 5' DNA nuclease